MQSNEGNLFHADDNDWFFKDYQESPFNYQKFDDLNSVCSFNPSVTTENFQEFFTSSPSLFSNIETYENLFIEDDVDKFIFNLQIKIKPYYFKCDFSTILNLLESQFPNFFVDMNYMFLYTIQKLRFFKLLQIGQDFEINNFYFDSLLRLLKEVKPKTWKNKHNFFIKLMKKRDVFVREDFLAKYYEQFNFELDKAIRNFLAENKEDFKSKPVIKPPKEVDVEEINTDIPSSNTGLIPQVADNIEEASTKAEFSDFEDELNFKLCDDETPVNSLSIPNMTENQKSKKEKELNLIRIPKLNTNISITTNTTISEKPKAKAKKSNKSDEILFNQLPFLSSFKPKYAKRETIDKKIIRHFRQYVISLNKTKKINLDSNSKDYSFYILLINGDLLPPLNYYDTSSNEKIVFKSFNSNYLLWFFSKHGIKELYLNFTTTQGETFVNDVAQYYGITEGEKNQLNNYVNNLPFIFDITLVNKITDEEGYNCGHIYRKNRGREKKRNENKNRKERSRELHYCNAAFAKDSSEEE